MPPRKALSLESNKTSFSGVFCCVMVALVLLWMICYDCDSFKKYSNRLGTEAEVGPLWSVVHRGWKIQYLVGLPRG